ncbi:MAG TPA: TolC family protein [Candidatus Saccharimonadales bacterium]|nr:TolC family protein [Candidatus Saccharimonadales bacterium]
MMKDACQSACAQTRRASGFLQRILSRPAAALTCLMLALSLGPGTGRSPAAEDTNALPKRPMALEDCFRLALEQNLDLRIEQENPTFSRISVELARAVYDPDFIASARYDYKDDGRFTRVVTSSQLQIVTNNNQLVITNVPTGTTVERGINLINRAQTYRSGISGLGPMGLNYDLSANITDSSTSGNANTAGSTLGTVGLTLTQPLLRDFMIDAPRYNIAIARNQLKVSELVLRQRIIEVLTAVEQAYYELIFARENVRVTTEGLRLAERLSADDQKRVQIGMIPRLDEKQSASQVAARQADLSAALRSLATAQNNLKRLITTEYRDLHDAQLDPTMTLNGDAQFLDLQTSWAKGLAERPDLQQAKLNVERQGITLKFYKNQRLPSLDVSGTYGHGASGVSTREINDVFGDWRSGEKPFWGVGATFGIPLGNRAARERYRQGKVTADQLVLLLKQKEESILIEIDEAVNAVRTTREQVQSTAAARRFAEEALSAEQKKLDSGKSTSFVVLQLQRDLTSASSQEIRALADYNKAQAELSRAEGTTLERRRINLIVK